jgi:ketosteroid isomerase-like protein
MSANGTEPVDAVRRYIEAFNRGDIEAMAGCFAPGGSILDGMAPHVWRGESAARDWYRDVLTEGEHLGAEGYQVSLEVPLHADVAGDAAYVVCPASMSFRLRGVPVVQTGAVFTTALQAIDGEWRIAAWAWAKGRSAA